LNYSPVAKILSRILILQTLPFQQDNLTPRREQRYRCAFQHECAMKYLLAIVQFAFGFGLFPAATLPAYPHGGGLDAMAAITTGKLVGITCHRWPLAGQSFASQDEMLRKLV
jgi:hypothetical protein